MSKQEMQLTPIPRVYVESFARSPRSATDPEAIPPKVIALNAAIFVGVVTGILALQDTYLYRESSVLAQASRPIVQGYEKWQREYDQLEFSIRTGSFERVFR